MEIEDALVGQLHPSAAITSLAVVAQKVRCSARACEAKERAKLKPNKIEGGKQPARRVIGVAHSPVVAEG